MSADERIGPGLFVAVAGPSGAGKDTLIDGARNILRQNSLVVFPRRIVTRPASASEDHDSSTNEDFERARNAGEFALWWSAHGHQYAIPQAIDEHIGSGKTVVCNVSRAVIETIRLRYKNTCYVLITAPPDILAKRLAGRRRTSDGNIVDRMERIPSGQAAADFTINNVENPAKGIRILLSVLTGERGASFSSGTLMANPAG